MPFHPVTIVSDDAPIPVTAFAPIMSLGPETRIEITKVER